MTLAPAVLGKNTRNAAAPQASMLTLRLEDTPSDLAKAAEIIRSGGLVAFPTETVYGLGTNAFDPLAAAKIYAAKGRPSDNPLIVHLASREDVGLCVSQIPKWAGKLMDAFWPGPLTVIFEKSPAVPREVTGGQKTVALRCPAHFLARKLIRAAGTPIAAPSANLSGRPSPTSAAHVLTDLDGRIDAVFEVDPCNLGIESTIIDLSGAYPQLLRPGSITLSMIEDVLGPGICRGLGNTDEYPIAPGMKYTHYAPQAKVIVVKGSPEETAAHINRLILKSPLPKEKIGIFASTETAGLYPCMNSGAKIIAAGSRKDPKVVAQTLFDALRTFDQMGAELIYAESFYETELGWAVMNRLEKAAGGDIIEL